MSEKPTRGQEPVEGQPPKETPEKHEENLAEEEKQETPIEVPAEEKTEGKEEAEEGPIRIDSEFYQRRRQTKNEILRKIRTGRTEEALALLVEESYTYSKAALVIAETESRRIAKSKIFELEGKVGQLKGDVKKALDAQPPKDDERRKNVRGYMEGVMSRLDIIFALSYALENQDDFLEAAKKIDAQLGTREAQQAIEKLRKSKLGKTRIVKLITGVYSLTQRAPLYKTAIWGAVAFSALAAGFAALRYYEQSASSENAMRKDLNRALTQVTDERNKRLELERNLADYTTKTEMDNALKNQSDSFVTAISDSEDKTGKRYDELKKATEALEKIAQRADDTSALTFFSLLDLEDYTDLIVEKLNQNYGVLNNNLKEYKKSTTAEKDEFKKRLDAYEALVKRLGENYTKMEQDLKLRVTIEGYGADNQKRQQVIDKLGKDVEELKKKQEELEKRVK